MSLYMPNYLLKKNKWLNHLNKNDIIVQIINANYNSHALMVIIYLYNYSTISPFNNCQFYELFIINFCRNISFSFQQMTYIDKIERNNSQNQQQVQYLDYIPPKITRKRERQLAQRCILPQIGKRLAETKQNEQKTQAKVQLMHLSITAQLDQYELVCFYGDYSQFQCDALVLPYLSTNFEYYPSCQLKEYLDNDVDKLKSLNAKGGDIYLKLKNVCKSKFRAYIKVEQDAMNQFAKGLNNLIELISTNAKISIHTICIAYPQKLFDLPDLIKILCSELICKINLKIVIVLNRNQLFVQAFTFLNTLLVSFNQN